ncbi:MAG TPA: hypothetical protein VFF65_04875 [Phycisphaerales bacterium]|nr:hypothetical protein [Phycisphaerales bacterium]
MSLLSIKPQSLIAAAALLAPMALVQTVRMVLGSGLPRAHARARQRRERAGANRKAESGRRPPGGAA